MKAAYEGIGVSEVVAESGEKNTLVSNREKKGGLVGKITRWASHKGWAARFHHRNLHSSELHRGRRRLQKILY